MNKWFGILILWVSLSANAQTSKITGTSEVWKGKHIRLISQTDPITKINVYVDVDTIAPDGSFELTANTTETGLYYLAVNRFRAPIWLEPNTTYQITIIPDPENIPVETWKYGSFEYALSTQDSTDVNYEISKFNREFYNFYLNNAQYIGSHRIKNKVQSFEKSFAVKQNSNKFIDNFKKYSFAEMKLSSSYKKNELYEKYLKDQPILLNNSAYFKFFDLFYADYFQSFDSRFGGATLSNRMRMGIETDSLFALLKQDPFMENDSLAQIVTLNAIANVYTNKSYSKKSLIEMLDAIASRPLTTEAKEISERLKVKIVNPLMGSDISHYNNLFEEPWQTHQDTLPTVVMVTYEGSTNSEKEVLILKTLAGKYENVARFAEIKIGATSHKQNKDWPVYYPNNDYSFLEEFRIYTFPHVIWINGENKIVHNGIEKPSSGLESRLYKLQSIYDERNRIKVGQ